MCQNFLREKQRQHNIKVSLHIRGLWSQKSRVQLHVMGGKVQHVGIKAVLRKCLMLNSGLKDDNTASLDNQPFLQTIKSKNRQPFWEADDPLLHCSFYSTLHRKLRGVDKGLRTSNFNHKQ